MAISLDIGTMFLVMGEVDNIAGGTSFSVQRNCFLQANTDSDTEETLKENNWTYAKYDNKYYILGEDAIKLKNLLSVKSTSDNQDIIVTKVGELRRPMKDGILNTGEEKLSVAIIQKIIAGLIGKPNFAGETLCFCAPGDPVDKNFNVLFHKSMLTNFLKSLGYNVECIPEALAIIFSERPVAEDPTEDNNEAPFSGVGISCGAGMMNVCLRGSTKIPLLDGTEKTLSELSTNYSDKEFWVYSCKPDGQIVPGKARLPRLTKSNAELVRIHLDSGDYFDCTPDHLIMLRNGEYKKAEELSENESLMPLYRQKYTFPNSKNEYEKVKNNRTGKWNATHRLIAAQYQNCQIKQGEVVHHKDFNPLNNEPDNLDIMTNSDHSKLHRILANYSKEKLSGKTLEEIFGDKNIAKKIGKRRVDGIRKALKDPQKKKNMIHGIVEYNKQWKGKSYNDKYGTKSQDIKDKLSKVHTGKKISEETKKKISQSGAGKFGKYERTDEVREKTSSSLKGNTPWNKGLSGDEYKKRYANGFKNQYSNHKVVKIERLIGTDNVYDLTVDKYSNFALSSGVFVHNCLSWKKMPLINYSIARSGDWIDEQSAKTSGVSQSSITRYKESHLDLSNIDYSDMRQAALDIYYQSMIEHALKNFAEKFNQLRSDDQISTPLEIVVAGGTASVKGFISKFEQVLSGLDLPFKVKGVRLANNPLYTVANGCLVKALSTESKNNPQKSNNSQSTQTEEVAPKRVKLK